MGKKTIDFFIEVLDICPTVEYAMKQKYTSCIYHLMQECKKERNGGKSNEKNADLVLTLALTLGVCSQALAADKYTIALIAPFTGDNAQYGEAYKTGLQVLCDEVNADGGINGAELTFETFDDASDAAQSTNMAQIVTSDEKYIAAIGSYTSTCALAFGSIFDEAKMPVMVPNAGNSMIATDYTYTFQRGMTIPIESALMARYAVKAIDNLKAEGVDCEVVAKESFNEGEVRDYSAICLKLKDAKPDIIVVNMGYVECAAILTQAQQVGLTDVKWLGNQSMYTTDFTNLVGDAGKGFYVSTGFYADNPDENIQSFIAACKAIDGKIPNAYQRNAYECASMIAYCLRNGATTRQELYDALLAIDYWPGKTGANKWINRQVEEEYLILQYQGDGLWNMLQVNQ